MAVVEPLFLLIFLACALQLASAQQGFISLDCGLPRGTNYTDETTGITYTSDADYIHTGESRQISSTFFNSTKRQYRSLRSFPTNARNCYTLRPVVKGSRYLIRAWFMYGNYDGEEMVPVFDLYLGLTYWSWVALNTTLSPGRAEIIATATSDFFPVCLVNLGTGTPFINTLELRQLDPAAYNVTDETNSLVLRRRYDVGSSDGEVVRYKKDVYDRVWNPLNQADWVRSNTTSRLNTDTKLYLPEAAMATAVSPLNGSDTLYFNLTSGDPEMQFHVFRHFAELELLKDGQVREFNMCITGVPSSCYGPFRPDYLAVSTVYTTVPFSGRQEYSFTFQRTSASTLPPILNAIEIYWVSGITETPTNDQDLEAIMDVRTEYQVEKNWMGDPCVPQNYSWEGLNCNTTGPFGPRIISLNLSFSGLRGRIPTSIANLTELTFLDLSGNNLTGEIPDFLAESTSLAYLNLSGNELNGSVPTVLLARSQSGSLQLSVDRNPNLCSTASCTISSTPDACPSGSCKKERNIVVPIAVSVSVFAVVLLAALFLLRRKIGKWKSFGPTRSYKESNGSFNLTNPRLTYNEIVNMTNDFERVIGRGGFGTVYHGLMNDGTQVAVKVLSQNVPGSSEFLTEAQLLMRVYHRNLVRFIGYCAEGRNRALVLEYLPKDNLGKFLSGADGSEVPLSWAQRLHIALDVAQGLEYLHIGCKPPIIHRDVKATNILLNDKLEAKIADFGLSKVLFDENLTHVSTLVKGTLGYLDPEYCISNNLNEKSDVYSFGIVLLELITGQPAIIQKSGSERISIVDWVGPLISRGDMTGLVDPKLQGQFDANSAWKAMEVAMACTPPKSVQRPTMSIVVAELKDCLVFERVTSGYSSLNVDEPDRDNFGHSFPQPISR